MRFFIKVLLLMFLLVNASYASFATNYKDLYLKGYVESILHQKYKFTSSIEVRQGEVYLPDNVAGYPWYDALLSELSANNDVKAVKLVSPGHLRRLSRAWPLPYTSLFTPPLADPVWPFFSASYNRYTNSKLFKNVINASMGKSFPLYRKEIQNQLYMELGVFADANVMFDAKSTYLNMINADYKFGIPVSFQYDLFSSVIRLTHQSSNGSKDYVGKSGITNLSYKSLDVLFGFQPTNLFSMYLGGGYIFSSNPSTFGKWFYQGSVNVRIVPDSDLIPTFIMAFDAKGYEETNYIPAKNFKIGFEINEHSTVTLDIYEGYMYQGSFFKDKVTSAGISLTFY